MEPLILDNAFERRFLLLCEGVGDKGFFCRLFEQHGIGGDFDIKFVSEKANGPGGRSGIGQYIRSFSGNENYLDKVEAVLIVSDSDEDQSVSFAEVQQQLKKTDLPIPENPKTIARKIGKKATAVLMVPTDGPGNLESLCLPSAYQKWGLEEQLNQWVGSTPACEWSQNKQAKVKIQALIAVHHKKRPETGFASHWNSDPELRIPVDGNAFADIVTFIRDFAENFAREK